MNKWIDCLDDEEPENGQIVLAYSKIRGYVIAEYETHLTVNESYAISAKIFWEKGNNMKQILPDPEYWMPIPELPEDCYE
jgi:hypothetical protein